ncbi:branched-chain amino acid ABC transporter ATP-binding protein/permease [Cognatishimia sp. 1_MG-2023]|uniref:branched-chain amino acid ABC transporter ATP-binding protein/permease n=1 Tax=Cognatishimia sp. 1_MG-2023 TaxID=3062642 RepID=UPI0026E37BB3|nr:branched-chain amino acid ABC transporter ATP-binding protein/permease [Cognatishimia sp. 1_MG-2023]MDO6728222.1 branched-chain amino acid ABC transporter ATP-binding protein/permease [Cognatishimia sp. 1_MG-2023]
MRGGLVILALLCLGAAGLAAIVGAPAVANTISYFLIVVVLVTGLGIYVGNTGIVSFGHPSFMGIGAYLTAILVMPDARKGALFPNLPDVLAGISLHPLVGLLVAAVFVGLVGLILGMALSRLNGASATIATLGVLIVVHSLMVGGTTFTRGAQAVYGVPKVVTPFYAALAATAVIILANWFKFSKWGLLARAGREDEAAASASGISIFLSRTLAFSVSTFVMALGGGLFALQIGVFSPSEFYFGITFSLLAMLIVGGANSTTGAVSGALLITLLTEVLRRVEPGFELGGISVPALFGLTTIGTSLALIATLYLRPEGLFGASELDDVLPFKKHRVAQTYPASEVTKATEGALAVRNLTKTYGGVTAVSDATLELKRGEILGLIGPNGSGKSTFLSCASGVQRFDRGEVAIGDKTMPQAKPNAFAHAGVGRTFQNIRLFGRLSVEENVAAAMAAVPSNRARQVHEVLARVNLEDLATRTADTLSYGQQRRLEIARALAIDPAFLLLDEPAAGMNDTETAELAGIIASLRNIEGLGILIVDHDLPMILKLSDRIAVLNEGRLIAVETPEEIKRNPEVAQAYFGERRNTGADNQTPEFQPTTVET